MPLLKVLADYKKMGDAAFELKAQSVLNGMTGNASFPAPPIAVADLVNATKAYSDALVTAAGKDKVKISAKNDARKVVEDMLTTLAQYINYSSAGQKTVLLSSGFSVSADTKAGTTLGEPQNFSLLPGAISGEMMISIDSVANARNYVFQYAKSPVQNDAWSTEVSSYPYFNLTGLQPLTMYDFRILVGGNKGQVAYTPVISKAVA
jgi:hypothetical protein